jgi:hypothetical protein
MREKRAKSIVATTSRITPKITAFLRPIFCKKHSSIIGQKAKPIYQAINISPICFAFISGKFELI